MVKIGIDLVELKRFENLIKNPIFLEKTFHESEIEKKTENMAAKFAIKEAFFKASQIKIKNWNEITVMLFRKHAQLIYDEALINFKIKNIICKYEIKKNHAFGIVILNSQIK